MPHFNLTMTGFPVKLFKKGFGLTGTVAIEESWIGELLLATRLRVSNNNINNNNNGILFGRTRYKFWVLAVILLLAFWSMFTGSVTLKWSTAGNLNPLIDDFDSRLHSDLDILEVEDREKVVRKMWDVYTHSRTIRLPKFWQMAFEAAFEDLTSDLPSVRNAAVFEIAKMSLLSTLENILQPPPPALKSTTTVRTPIKGTLPSKLQKARRRL